MRFVTVATHSGGYYEYLLESCKRHGIELDVLGWGMKFQGWVWRMDLIRSYYEGLHPEEIVCFIDAYDVIILKDAKEIEERFLETGARIIVAEDYNTDPLEEWKARMFLFGTCKNVRVNAGTYIGYAGDILWMLNTMCSLHDCKKNEGLDDQKMMTHLCNIVPYRFLIDTDKRIFLCICFKNGMRYADIDVDKQRMLTYKGIMDPCILHGAGKADLDEVIRKLGYDIQQKDESVTKTAKFYGEKLVICATIITVIILVGVFIRLMVNKLI